MKTANKTASTTALAPVKPQPLIAKLQPPPRKEDVINAMLVRAREKFQAEKALRDVEITQMEAEIHRLAFAEMKKHKGLKPVSVYIDQYDECVDFKFEIKSPEIKGLVLKYCELKRTKPTFDEKATRQMIRESLDTSGQRVAAILSNPDAVKQIDRMLEEATA